MQDLHQHIKHCWSFVPNDVGDCKNWSVQNSAKACSMRRRMTESGGLPGLRPSSAFVLPSRNSHGEYLTMGSLRASYPSRSISFWWVLIAFRPSSRAVLMKMFCSIRGLTGDDRFCSKNKGSWTGYKSLIDRITDMILQAQGTAIGVRWVQIQEWEYPMLKTYWTSYVEWLRNAQKAMPFRIGRICEFMSILSEKGRASYISWFWRYRYWSQWSKQWCHIHLWDWSAIGDRRPAMSDDLEYSLIKARFWDILSSKFESRFPMLCQFRCWPSLIQKRSISISNLGMTINSIHAHCDCYLWCVIVEDTLKKSEDWNFPLDHKLKARLHVICNSTDNTR